MRGRVLLLLLLAGTSCYRQREVPRRDWGAIPARASLTVVTLDGQRRKFNDFVFSTQGLTAWVRDEYQDPVTRGTHVVHTDSALIPLDSITAVRVRQLDRRKTALLLAAATAAAFVVLAETMDDTRPPPVPRPPPSSSPSCPFIFSHDGTGYVFDSETYAGAVARSLERSDVDNLEHLRPVDGRYRLRVANGGPETDYTDELTLLLVDHPRGTRALPDVSGGVHVVAAGVAPARTTVVRGDTIPSRASWEFVFPRPLGDTAALVLRVRNTPVGPFALYHTLDLLGSEVYAWYAALDRQPMTALFVKSWMASESYLQVQARRADSLRPVALIPHVGAAIAKDYVVLLDLRGTRDDSVRVRLESGPRVWTIERADLAEYRGPAAVQALPPARATDNAGVDVHDLIARRDRRYLVTTPGRDVELEYAVPRAREEGMTRSALVRTAGHYYVETNDSVPSRRHIVERLMRDRAFAQRYFADAWVRAGGDPLIAPPHH